MKAEPHKTAVAVSTVVIFGTVSMFLFPALWRTGLLGLNTRQMALYTVRRCTKWLTSSGRATP